jgi:hypothetical protein
LTIAGDGQNDLCPSLRLGKNDIVCARKGFKLARMLDKSVNKQIPLKARLFLYESGNEIVETLGLPPFRAETETPMSFVVR